LKRGRITAEGGKKGAHCAVEIYGDEGGGKKNTLLQLFRIRGKKEKRTRPATPPIPITREEDLKSER